MAGSVGRSLRGLTTLVKPASSCGTALLGLVVAIVLHPSCCCCCCCFEAFGVEAAEEEDAVTPFCATGGAMAGGGPGVVVVVDGFGVVFLGVAVVDVLFPDELVAPPPPPPYATSLRGSKRRSK